MQPRQQELLEFLAFPQWIGAKMLDNPEVSQYGTEYLWLTPPLFEKRFFFFFGEYFRELLKYYFFFIFEKSNL